MIAFIQLEALAKLLLIAILAPAWWPIAKILWGEVNESLAEDGGFFGREPSRDEAAEIARRRRLSGDSLVSVPLEGQGGRGTPPPARGAGRKGGKEVVRGQRGPVSGTRKRGF